MRQTLAPFRVITHIPTQTIKRRLSAQLAETGDELRRLCFRQLGSGDDGLAVHFALVHFHHHPFCHVIDRRAHAARGRLRVGLALFAVNPFAIRAHMPRCFICARHKIRIARTGGIHAERFVQQFLARIFPTQIIRARRRDRAFGHAKIGVRVFGTKTARGFLITQRVQHLRAVPTQVFQFIARMCRQTAVMRVHVADGDFARDVRVIHFERGVEVREFGVPRNFSVADQFRHNRRADGFGHGRELKHRILVHLFGLAHFARAKTFGIHNLALIHHCYCNTGQSARINLFLHRFFQIGNGFVQIRLGHRTGSLCVYRHGNQHYQNKQRGQHQPTTEFHFALLQALSEFDIHFCARLLNRKRMRKIFFFALTIRRHDP